MKLAINQATLMKTPMELFLKSISKAGYNGVELRRDETFFYINDHPISDLNDLLINYNLKCLTFNAIELFSLCSEKEFQNILQYTEVLMKIGNEIDCDTIIAVPSFLDDPNISIESIKEKTVKRLKILTKIAKKYDFKLGFEPLGFKDCSVRTLPTALEIITHEDLPDIGLVIDTFHFFIGGNSLTMLDSIDIDRIWLIHVNDVPKKPFSVLRDSDRVLPGQGCFDLKSFLKKVKSMGFDSWLSLELFNEVFWKKDPYIVALNSINSLKRLL